MMCFLLALRIISIQEFNKQTTGRPLTSVQEITDDYYKKELVMVFKKKFASYGTVIEHTEHGEVIQVQGDPHKNPCQLLGD